MQTLQNIIDTLDESKKQFLETLLTIRGGQLFELFSDASRECVMTTQHVKNKTKVVLTLTIENKSDDLLLTGEVDKKIPQKKSFNEYIYTDDSGVMYKNNPNQLSMLNAKGQVIVKAA